MHAVWDESAAQAREMIETLTTKNIDERNGSSGKGETTGTIEGLRTIAINVIGLTSYGKRQGWSEAANSSKPPAGHKLTFMEALLAIVNNHIISVFVPAKFLTTSFMPRMLQTLGHATIEFPQYAREMIAGERASLTGSNSLLGALVKIADDKKRPYRLTEEEIIGNLFNFTLAGFDTTATTMAYAVMMLAIEPQWQDWIVEETDRVADLAPENEYEKTFPKLTRCLVLMVRKAAYLAWPLSLHLSSGPIPSLEQLKCKRLSLK